MSMKKWVIGSAVGLLILSGIGLMMANVAMGPAQIEILETIEPNETGFLIPAEGDSSEQTRFRSEEFYRNSQIATLRVSIPTRKHILGRGLGNFEWIPEARVSKVDRTPVTREWTQDTVTGTSTNDDALKVQSVEPVKFGVGASISAVVLPDDTAVFRYNYGSKSLSEILDQNVRGFVQDRLSFEFGRLTLAECKAQKGTIFTRVEEQASEHFKKKGLTILYFGSYKGLNYDNPKVQESIDNEFLAQVDAQVAKKTEEAQRVRNQTNVLIAAAEREAAEALHTAQAAMQFQTDLQIQLMEAEAARTLAQRTKGQLPEVILPQSGGSNLLLNLNH